MQYIKITLEDPSLKIETSEGLTFDTAMDMIGSLTLGLLQHAAQNAPATLQTKLVEELYDAANAMFSGILLKFAPEIELRPDLTAEALLAKENEILDAQP